MRSGRRIRLWLAAGMLSAILSTVLQASSSVFAITNPVRPPAGHATAPVKLPASSGEPASRQPKKLSVGEQPDLRTRYSSTRYNADHSFTTSTSVHPVNYRATNGGWQPVDSTLIASNQGGYAWQNRANSFQAQFKGQLGDDYLRWVVDGQAVSMSLQGGAPARASVKGSTIRYPGALPRVNATYSVLGDGLEEVLELQDASAQSSFQFQLKTPKGTSARQQGDGSWVFALPGRAPGSFWLKAPYASDSGARAVEPGQPHARVSVQENGDGFQVTLSVDQTWLHDSARRFPVFVDPTISVQPDTLDTTFTADCATCQGFVDASGRMFIGVSAFPNTYREALQFDLSAIPAGVSVTGANLGVFYDQACIAVPGQFCGGADHQVDVHRMTAAWSTASTTSSIQFDPTVLSSFLLSASAGQEWMNWDVSSAVSGWVSGAQPNYGLYLMLSSEKKGDSGPAPPGNTFQVGQLAPVLTVTYSGDAVSLAQPGTLHANGAELSWSQYTGPSGAPFQQYQVHRSPAPNFTPSATTLLTSISDLATTTFRDTSAAPGGTFYYAVVANSSKSNEVKVTLPADGQSSVSLRLGPGQGQATFMYLYDKFVNCANYGADKFLAAGADSTGVYRSLLQFVLPQIPSTATNVSASLSVLHFLENSVDMTLHTYPVTSSWNEGTGTTSPATCTGDGATWYKRTGGVPWASQGGDFDAGTASGAISIPANETENWDTFDVSSIVSKWVSGQAPNLGFLLKSDSEIEGTFNFAVFASNDYGASPAVRPLLQVTYTDGSHAIAPTVAVSAPAPGAMVTGSAVNLAAAASDDGAVSQVQFFVDGVSVGSASQAPWKVTWNSASVANGSHTITAKATDNAGNSTTSAGVAVTVNNYPPPTSAITSPANNATGLKGTVSVTTSETVASGLAVSKVELYVDGALSATSTASPWSFSWNTLDPNLPAYDGSHTLVSKVYDSSGLNAKSATVTVTVANTAGTLDRATFDPALVPQAMSYDPGATSQLVYPVDVGITNASSLTWNAATTTLRYRWYLAGSSTSVSDSADVASLGLGPGQKQTVRVNVLPPALADGTNSARYALRFDLVDSSVSPAVFFASRGNQPLDNPVLVNKALRASALGLEHYFQYTSTPVGAGMDSLFNVANGNLLLTYTPLSNPGRGLSTFAQLTYNSLEDHSGSPAGNNFSLSVSGLTRLGDPIDIHPNKADLIAGRSNKFINITDADGTPHTFTGVTGADGVTFWEEPPGVHLFLRSLTTDTTNPRYWALTRPDRVTFYYNSDGFPTFVTDKNGNTLSFTLTAVQPGDDPGGPKYHVTKVTDAAGQGTSPAPNRSFNITYFTKATARKPQIRGKIASITDHLNHGLDFSYYDDGNLLKMTERGGTKADGSFLGSRSWVFTYTTSDGSGPAIPNASDRVNPDPRTSNESTRIYSVRDPRGHETLYTYLASGSAQDRWKLASLQDRSGAVTSFSYDDTNQVTTVALPTPSGQAARTYHYTYDADGKPVQIADPLGHTTQLQWSADFAVRKLTEPSGQSQLFTYDDNGYPTDIIDELGGHTVLTYQSLPADSTDVSAHWNPGGGANGTGRTIPHLSQLATKEDPNQVALGSNVVWRFAYDAQGNLTQVTKPLYTNSPARNTYNPDGTLATTTDYDGNQTTYLTYDANGLATEVVEADDSPTAPTHPIRFGFDDGGRLQFVQDANHGSSTGTDPTRFRTYFYYDSFNRLGRESTPKSTSLNLTNLIFSDTSFDANDNVVKSVGPHAGDQDTGQGDTTTTSYDAMDRETLTTGPATPADPSGERTRTTYDVAGRVTQVTTPLGVENGTPSNTHTVNYAYDALDRNIGETEYHVNPDGSVSQLHDLRCYDSMSNLVSDTAPKAGLSSVTCPATTATGFTTVMTYDAARHLTSQTDPDGHQTMYQYDADGNRTKVTDANNNTTTLTYDALNRVVQSTQPFITGTSPHNVVSRIEYDAMDDPVRSISPRAYDASSDKQNFTNYVTTYHYDKLNRQVRVDLPVDSTYPTQYYTHSTYDFNGNLTSTSLATTQSDPNQVPATDKTVLTYFDPGWIATSRANGNPKVHFDYNAKGQQTQRTPEDKDGKLDTGKTVFWSYLPNGLLASRTDQQGQPVSYTYNADQLLVTTHDASGLTSSKESFVDTQNAYDDLDRLSRTDVKKQSDANWTFSTFTYDLNGNITDLVQNGQESSPGGTLVKDGRKQHANFDQANWVTDQTDFGILAANADEQRFVASFTPVGQQSRMELDKPDGSGGWTPKQVSTYDYYANGLLNHLTTTNGTGTTTLESHAVQYLDGSGIFVDGNRTKDTFSLQPGGSGSGPCKSPTTCSAAYTYDPRDRLVKADDGHGSATSYTLDGSGNILTEAANGSTKTYTYQGNQLQTLTSGGQTADYHYDELGRLHCVTTSSGSAADCGLESTSSNLLTDYEYDYLDRLSNYAAFSAGSQTDSSSYTYDALNRISSEDDLHPSFNGSTRTTQFSYLGNSPLETGEQQSNSSGTLDAKSYTYDAFGRRQGMTDTPYSGGAAQTPNVYTYGYDAHGSVSQLVDSSGISKASYGYKPYGTPDTALTQGDSDTLKPINPFRFEAKRIDSGSGTLNMGARQYLSDATRFLTPDRFFGALSDLNLSTDPLTQNRYGLSGGNPISFIEWDGHFGWGDITSGLSSAWHATTSFVSQHSADIAGFAAGLAVGVGCEALLGPETGGLATVGCAAAAGAVSSMVTHGLTSKDQSVQGYLEAGASGAVAGAAGGVLGRYVAGPLAKYGLNKLAGRFAGDEAGDLTGTVGGLRVPQIGDPDGGPGAWAEVTRGGGGTGKAWDFQEQATGVSRTREYDVNGVKFEGWDPKTRVLTDAKYNYGQENFVDPKTGKFVSWWANSKSNKGGLEMLREARNQIAAVKGKGVKIEWVASDQRSAFAIQSLLRDNNITQITVKVAGAAADDGGTGAWTWPGPLGGAAAGTAVGDNGECFRRGPC